MLILHSYSNEPVRLTQVLLLGHCVSNHTSVSVASKHVELHNCYLLKVPKWNQNSAKTTTAERWCSPKNSIPVQLMPMLASSSPRCWQIKMPWLQETEDRRQSQAQIKLMRRHYLSSLSTWNHLSPLPVCVWQV